MVGVGAIGSFHARIYTEHPLAALSGVVDTNPVTARAVAERLRVPWFTEVSDLLDRCDFSAASVSVPEHHRYQVAVPLALPESTCCWRSRSLPPWRGPTGW